MALSDYKLWNEDAQWMWWQEEGRHVEEPEFDEYEDNMGYDDEDPDDDVFPDPPQRYNAFGQRLRPDAPELPGDYEEPHIPEDAHLEAAYEDRFGAEDIMENDY